MSVYDGIMRGLNEAIEHAEGKRRLKTNRVTIQPLRDFSGAEIKALRLELNLTQVSFAEFFGVSIKTVEAWEAERNRPEGPARRLMSLLQADPLLGQRAQIIHDVVP